VTISLLLVPVLLLAIVALLGFVGCGLDSQGTASPITSDPYTTVVAATPDLVAWWPLKDAALPTAAADAVGPGPDGSYPGTYGTRADPVGKPGLSAKSPGTLNLGQGSLISNDASRGSIEVDGGYAEVVPFHAELNTDQFTLEAWVRTKWTEADEKAYRVVFFSRETAAVHGLQLHANPDNHWEVYVGDNTPAGKFLTASDPIISLGTTDYLVVTYDGTTLTLYVNGNNRGEIAVTYFPNTVRPLSIGAAVTDPPASIFPFNGQIAEVALYKRALTDIEVFQRMKATAA
jgi:hypothetical protein